MLRFILPLLLVGCATAPAHLTQAKAAVDADMRYVNYATTGLKSLDGYVKDETYSKPPHLAENEGNCTDFAYAYKRKLGGQGFVRRVALPDGQEHAYLVVDCYRLDVREGWVVKTDESECK